MESSLSKFDAVFQTGINGDHRPPRRHAAADVPDRRASIDQPDRRHRSPRPRSSRCPPAASPASRSTRRTSSPTCRPRVNPSYPPQLAVPVRAAAVAGLRRRDQPAPRQPTPAAILNPGVLNPSAADPRASCITRIRFDQPRAEFERSVNQMLLNVEVAYWNLYCAYWNLYSREQGLRFAFEAFKLEPRPADEAGRGHCRRVYQYPRPVRAVPRPAPGGHRPVLENERQLRARWACPSATAAG